LLAASVKPQVASRERFEFTTGAPPRLSPESPPPKFGVTPAGGSPAIALFAMVVLTSVSDAGPAAMSDRATTRPPPSLAPGLETVLPVIVVFVIVVFPNSAAPPPWPFSPPPLTELFAIRLSAIAIVGAPSSNGALRPPPPSVA
jgi:hypothetical protein